MAARRLTGLADFAATIAVHHPDKFVGFDGTMRERLTFSFAKARIRLTARRGRESHGTRPGHRSARRAASRRTSSRDSDPPDGLSAGLQRHPRYGWVNDALGAWLEAHS